MAACCFRCRAAVLPRPVTHLLSSGPRMLKNRALLKRLTVFSSRSWASSLMEPCLRISADG